MTIRASFDAPPTTSIGNGSLQLRASDRLSWVDYSKGIAILLVVAGHVNRGLLRAGFVHEPSASILAGVDRFIYAFHMPVFFFAGGLFAHRLRTRPLDQSAATIARSIIYPYFVWATLQNLLMLSLRPYTNTKVTLCDIGMVFIEPPMQFWFLYVYFLLLTTYLLLAKAGFPRFGLSLFFAILWVLAANGIRTSWMALTSLQLNGVYFMAGDLVQFRVFTYSNNRRSAPWVLPAAILCYSSLSLLLLQADDGSPAVRIVSAFLGVVGTCLTGYFLTSNGWADVLRVCGVFSLEIYLLHTIVSAGFRIGLHRVLGITNLATHIVLGILGGILVPLAIASYAHRNSWEWLFRFPSAGRSTQTTHGITRTAS